MSTLLSLILYKSIAHGIPTYTTPILENSASHINVRRSSKPASYYSNSLVTLLLILAGKVKIDPERNNVHTLNRKWKQSKSISRTCQFCNSTIRANVNLLLCIHYNNLVHLKYTVKKIKSCHLEQRVCQDSDLKDLLIDGCLFYKGSFNRRNMLEKNIPTISTMQI